MGRDARTTVLSETLQPLARLHIDDPMSHPPTTKRDTTRVLSLGLMALAVGAAAITSQSLWMDEGSAAFKALMPTFKEWLWITFRIGGSDVQMPAYMASLWGWHQLGFTSEYALRCINLPFLILMVLALRRVPFWPLLCLTSPFVLYYVGELRPYTMQMAGGALAALGLGQIINSDKDQGFPGLHPVACAALLLTASSLTAAVWAAGLVGGMLIIRPGWLARRGFWLRALPWTLAGLLLSGYYGYTILQGYRATSSGGGGLLSIGFGFYEMAGLLGLGPSRDEVRASPMAIVRHLPWLLPASACLLIAWSLGVRVWLTKVSRRDTSGVVFATVFPVVILAAVALVADFRVLGRHLSPAIPAVLLPLAVCLSAVMKRPVLVKCVAVTAVMILLTSSLFLRFHGKHSRDDYRTASGIAFESLAKGQSVLWQADMNATRYYAFRKGGMPLVNAIQQLESNPPGLMFADLVVINRPDLRFKGTDYRNDLKKNDFLPRRSFTGFEVWGNRYTSKN